MSMLQMSLSSPISAKCLSSMKSISGGPARVFLSTEFSTLSLTATPKAPFRTTTIRMGGGPRTYPGGVSKWQWKRMQAKKAKQLLKARLARERQIYEMRKRAELKAAVSELERPWEVVEKAPTLFSVDADEQLKVLADRFQRPGGFDMWSEKDGPELFKPDDELPSARFFPKGVVHSIKPYGKIRRLDDGSDELSNSDSGLVNESNPNNTSNNFRKGRIGLNGEGNVNYLKDSTVHKTSTMRDVQERTGQPTFKKMLNDHNTGKSLKNNKSKKRRNRRMYSGDSEATSSTEINGRRSGKPDNSVREHPRHNLAKFKDDSNAEVYDLRLQNDGRYEFQPDY